MGHYYNVGSILQKKGSQHDFWSVIPLMLAELSFLSCQERRKKFIFLKIEIAMYLPDTTRLMCTWTQTGSMHKTCTRLSQIRGGSDHLVQLLTKKLLPLMPAGKREIRFLQWSPTGWINHTSECLGAVDWQNVDLVSLLCFGFCLLA